VPLPMLPGGEMVQFWGVAAMMAVIAVVMLLVFRLNRWI